MQFHKTHVVFHGNGAEDRRPHALTVRGDLAAGLIELLVRRFKASASSAGVARPLAGSIALLVLAFGNSDLLSTRLNRRPGGIAG